ncbi:hypothetical protein HELRODRAFT_171891 [Helobdella robusta]|uniref:Endonuclease/exonuclease/phosphatase domain-containing protein n=1 Tax=Helobdella robusta TaxID=6412 RepID=T1F4T1_HELRO|nr:hypothetical protein HELRODRAFT_171891 [Helobdella robusta]ESO04888.1 hypothetical protein HELRODRAFT_171891 [Helobdella robusta]
MTNVDSITNKFFDLKIFLQSLDVAPDLIALSEVNPKNFNQCRVLSEFCLDDYSIISSGFAEQHRRGLMLFCKRSLLLTEINLNSSFKEYIIVKLCVSNRVLNILFVYRSPNSNVGNNDLLLKLINDVLALPGETLLFGDFNFPDINWDTSSFKGNDERVENKFLDLLKDKFLIQHISHPTRFRDGQTSNILDLVISSQEFINNSIHYPPLGNSDHSILEFKLTGFCCSAMECDKKYCFDLGDYINFRNVLGVFLQT